MKKLQIKIPLVLPDVPTEKDNCVKQLIKVLKREEGINKIHVASAKEDGQPQLCFHYQPELISIDRIIFLAKQTGAELTSRIAHLVFKLEGLTNTRQARQLERRILQVNGVLEANISVPGLVRLEIDTEHLSETEAYEYLVKFGLHVQEIKEEGNTTYHQKRSGLNKELFFSILSGVALGAGFAFSFIENLHQFLSLSLYIVSYFFGGYYTFRTVVKTISKGGFEIDFLMLVAAVGAAMIGEWAEGALLLFLFSLGHGLEHFAMNKAQKSIAALSGLAPKTAFVKKGVEIIEVALEKLNVGDIVIVRPNSKISADGFIVKGQGSVNQAPITGESMPVEKVFFDNSNVDLSLLKEENKVWAGTLNGNSMLEIQVLKPYNDSTLARLIKLVNEAQTQKSPTQLFADKFEKYYVPIVLLVVIFLNFTFLVIDETFAESFYRAMAVLVAASPCALAISTPSAVLSAIARAARDGVLIKGGRPLEYLGSIYAVAFDKTGTLTEGKPKLTHVITLENFNEERLLQLLIAVESLSDHPLAKAVVAGAKERVKSNEVLSAENSQSVLGKGVMATVDNKIVALGNLRLFDELDNVKPNEEVKTQIKLLESAGNTTMLVREDNIFVGIVALMDTPRKEAKSALEKLRRIGIRRMVMLTGDNQNVADAVAKEIGLKEAFGSLLPDAKVAAIKDMVASEKKVAMVGDGVNDAPAMAYSTVGIAMGAAGSDVALETADIALLADNLQNLPFAIALSRKSSRIIRQNVWISLGVVAVLVPITVLGLVNLAAAVFIHEGSTVMVVANALRLLTFKNKYN